jgi:hypothetical protein
VKHYYDGFDDYFRKISFNINRGRYRYIGRGSGRIVYDLGNGKVVKHAKNMKGIAQNIEEYNIALVDDSGLFARVSAVSDDFRFLIMEKAYHIKDISYVRKYYRVRSNNELYQIQEIRDIAEKYELLIRDLGRAVNWGLINGRPRIIDYGFTRTVRWKYYKTTKIGMKK